MNEWNGIIEWNELNEQDEPNHKLRIGLRVKLCLQKRVSVSRSW